MKKKSSKSKLTKSSKRKNLNRKTSKRKISKTSRKNPKPSNRKLINNKFYFLKDPNRGDLIFKVEKEFYKDLSDDEILLNDGEVIQIHQKAMLKGPFDTREQAYYYLRNYYDQQYKSRVGELDTQAYRRYFGFDEP